MGKHRRQVFHTLMYNMDGDIHAPKWTGKTISSSTQFLKQSCLSSGRWDVFTNKHKGKSQGPLEDTSGP